MPNQLKKHEKNMHILLFIYQSSEFPPLKWVEKLSQKVLCAWQIIVVVSQLGPESRGFVWWDHDSHTVIYIIYLSDK